MYKILTLNTISPKGLEILTGHSCQVLDQCSEPDGILLRSFKLSAENIAPGVLAIARAGAGVNNIPVESCTERGIPVFNAPGGNANAVKELVIAALLLSSRGIVQGIRYVDSLGSIGDIKELNRQLEAHKKHFKGVDLEGRTLGIIGLGAVGGLVAKAGLMMNMRVLGYDPALSVERAWSLPGEVERYTLLEHLVRDSDYVSIHVPALDSTRALINAELLENFKSGARLLNFSRQELIDVAALTESLDIGPLSCYVADFPHPQLINRDDTILMPHIGASTREAEQRCAVMAADVLYNFLATGNINHSVNFPTINLEHRSAYRLAVSNRNVPNMLTAILSCLGEANINLVDMLNRSRHDIAYNLIDLEQSPSSELLQTIRSLEGVVGVRLITA